MTAPTVRRPGLVTFIGILIYIQAAMAGVAAVVTIVFSASSRVKEAVGLSTAGMVTTGLWEALMAVVLLLVAGGIMRGSRGFRFLVALVMGIRIVGAVAVMLIHHNGGYLFNGLVEIAFATFVLWALYGYQPADDYFTKRESLTTEEPPNGHGPLTGQEPLTGQRG